jgi:hypothetical protein
MNSRSPELDRDASLKYCRPVFLIFLLPFIKLVGVLKHTLGAPTGLNGVLILEAAEKV